MGRIAFPVLAVATLACIVASIAPALGQPARQGAPAFVKEMPPGYRDWRLISVSHEAGNVNSIGAVLGNDVAIKTYREGKLPFPDGTIIAALHYKYVPSDENNTVFGQAQSFVAGLPTNVQFEERTQKRTPPAVGGSVISTATAQLATTL